MDGDPEERVQVFGKDVLGFRSDGLLGCILRCSLEARAFVRRDGFPTPEACSRRMYILL